ncbi:MAG: precorrin-6A reductase [Cyanothece sp. SIO2G6]|nr:precorrin-6A reductase [Cyanothece sp. SIO2G6]
MIGLIGGTSESRAIAHRLSSANYPWAATVVSPAATRLYKGLPGQVRVGPLDAAELRNWCQACGIRALIDASHPFATVISRQAIATGLPYLRFERPVIPLSPPAESLADLDSLFQPDYLAHRRVLITLGSKALPRFVEWQGRSHLFARILPTAYSQAQQSGFTPDRLICGSPATDPVIEQALWQHLRLDTVVTKASGSAGGVPLKLELAKALGVRLLVIARPPMSYPRMTHRIDVAIAFCQEVL